MISHPGYNKLVTALYSGVSAHVSSDPVFGVKTSLIKDFEWHEGEDFKSTYGTKVFERIIDSKPTRGCWLLQHDFVLVPREI
jgi:hypothetical protein